MTQSTGSNGLTQEEFVTDWWQMHWHPSSPSVCEFEPSKLRTPISLATFAAESPQRAATIRVMATNLRLGTSRADAIYSTCVAEAIDVLLRSGLSADVLTRLFGLGLGDAFPTAQFSCSRTPMGSRSGAVTPSWRLR